MIRESGGSWLSAISDARCAWWCCTRTSGRSDPDVASSAYFVVLKCGCRSHAYLTGTIPVSFSRWRATSLWYSSVSIFFVFPMYCEMYACLPSAMVTALWSSAPTPIVGATANGSSIGSGTYPLDLLMSDGLFPTTRTTESSVLFAIRRLWRR